MGIGDSEELSHIIPHNIPGIIVQKHVRRKSTSSALARVNRAGHRPKMYYPYPSTSK